MAKGAAKKVVADNKKALQFIWRGSWLISLLHLFLQLVFPGRRQMFLQNSFCWGMFVFSCVICVISYKYLEKETRVTYDKRTKDLLSEGSAITQPGLYEYVFDLIYLSWILQILSIIHSRIWLGYILIPVYALYKLWSKLVKPWFLASKFDLTSSQDDLKSKQKSDKKEKHMQKLKYLRG